MASTYIRRFDGTIARDFSVNGDRMGYWHDYVRRAANADDIRYLRQVSDRGCVSHVPLALFDLLPSGAMEGDFPIFARRGSLAGGGWTYKVVNGKVENGTIVPAPSEQSQVPNAEVVPVQPSVVLDSPAAAEVVPDGAPVFKLVILDKVNKRTGAVRKDKKYLELDARELAEYDGPRYVREVKGKATRYLELTGPAAPLALTASAS